MSLFRYIPIWRRSANGIVLYRCFEILGSQRFSVQSADYFDSKSLQARSLELEQQFLELLMEQSPCERSESYSSIEAAIDAFDVEFGNEHHA